MGYVAKRGLDVLVAAMALVALAPVIGVVGVVIASTLGRPVFFIQRRIGMGGLSFRLMKFRTMDVRSGEYTHVQEDEPRLGALGRLLRSWSIDELPSLWNVLKGELSLVGPRPLLPEYLPLYSPRQAKRHEVRPGITGWAQVHGRNAVDWPTRLEMDVWYVENQGLLLDLRILGMTVLKVLRREGINRPGYATMPPFRGER